MVECAPSGELGIAVETLREHSSYFNIISRNHKDNKGKQSKYITLHSEQNPGHATLQFCLPL